MSAPFKDKPEWMKSDPDRLEKALKRVRETNSVWMKENYKHFRAVQSIYQKNNPEKIKAGAKRWRANNAHYCKLISHNRRARIRASGGRLTARDIAEQLKAQTNKKGKVICWWCEKLLGNDQSVDHRVPLAKGGSNAPENIVITHLKCNLSKGAKMPWEYCGRLL